MSKLIKMHTERSLAATSDDDLIGKASYCVGTLANCGLHFESRVMRELAIENMRQREQVRARKRRA